MQTHRQATLNDLSPSQVEIELLRADCKNAAQISTRLSATSLSGELCD